MLEWFKKLIVITSVASLLACQSPIPRADDPYYAPVYNGKNLPAGKLTGSLYDSGVTPSIFEDHRARRVGDILTLMLSESTSSSKTLGTNIKKEGSSSMTGSASFGSSDGQTLATSAAGARDFKGAADSSQSNSLNGSISITVTDVLPNGVLAIRGEKWITLNRGKEYIRISGLLRPMDIQPDNTVMSSKLADARITYSGTGELADSNQIGWVDRIMMSPFWPF